VIWSDFNDFALTAQRFQDAPNACFWQLDQRRYIAASRRPETIGIGQQRRNRAPDLFIFCSEPDAMA
jgi:hypothetical protein